MAADLRTFQTPAPTTPEYTARLPEDEDEAFVYYAKWVLTAYGFRANLFEPATYRVEGYMDRDFASRLKYFKGKEANQIHTIIAVGVRLRYFEGAAVATFDDLAKFLEFLRTPEGGKAVTEASRREKFRAQGKGAYTAVEIAAAAQLTVQLADHSEHEKRLKAAAAEEIEELELQIVKAKEALQRRLQESKDEFYPATAFVPITNMAKNKESWVKYKAAHAEVANVVYPSRDQMAAAAKEFGEDVERKHSVDFLKQENRLDRLRAYVTKKVLSFRRRGKDRAATRLGNTLAAMGGEDVEEVPAREEEGDDDDDSDGEYEPEDEGDDVFNLDFSGAGESEPGSPEADRGVTPRLTRKQRKEGGRGESSFAGGLPAKRGKKAA